MIKKYTIIFALIWINLLSISAEDNIVLVVPFRNDSGLELEYLSEIIPNTFNALLEPVENYSIVSYERLKNYINENQYDIGDFDNRDTLLSIGDYFNANSIIRGSYLEDESFLVVEMEVIDTEEEKIVYRSSKFGKGGINAFEALDEIVTSMLQDFIGIELEYASLEIITDFECKLYIDNAFMGTTPIKKVITTGRHDIKLIYESENISGSVMDQVISLGIDEERIYNIKVLVDVTIEAELECIVTIDGIETGITPYEGKLLTGNEYLLQIIYEQDEIKEVVAEEIINTENEENVYLDFPVTGSIEFITGVNPFTGRIENSIFNEQINDLPFIYSNLPLGTYNLTAFIEDKEHDNRYVFYNEEMYLMPSGRKVIDLSDINFEKRISLYFIPSASQFHNRQRVKGSIVLSIFITSATVACLAPLISYLYYKNTYVPMRNAWNDEGESSGYTEFEVNSAQDRVRNLFYGFLISGLSTAFTVYIYSLIDGAINMNRIDRIMNY